ncbi:MAG: AAA family ATPase [Candidatus Latescibacteria bacterium]|jgi:endopeptidase Clp ATP-binding regulatory subunit ClpX|nr:ATPase [Gemmatimonadaceae bacterium]MDP6016549.1 AAA family ATPase [Candidatus Latescibacterota bacterium]MDP7448306.1 AAA family ATPase [Candidatus Latescibacterota bacterium]HJP30322.1 AAA family ATPase [Candidatus Latescibacterota bacterium]
MSFRRHRDWQHAEWQHAEWRGEKPGLDPEQIRRIIEEQQNRQASADVEGVENAGTETAGTDAGTPDVPVGERFDFHLKPQELIDHLDGFVVGQHRAKAILSTKICTHFNRLRLPDEDEEEVGRIKNNVLMIGPTGVGKTYLIRLIARRLGVPFVKADATKFSETGYVGGDVEDLVRELVHDADGDIELAQHGIIYLDEIDKIAASGRSAGPDVSGSGVQRNLLKLMEETDVDLKSPHDLSSQMETVIQMQRTGKAERKKVNTRDILFVVSGAFSGLEDIIARRLNQGSMGFQATAEERGDAPDQADELFGQVRSQDLIEFGFESEFIGRLPVTAVLDELSRDDFLAILRSDNSSVVLSKVRDFLAYDIGLTFEDAALERLADLAIEEHTGARGLVSAVEKVLLDFECRLPSLDVECFAVTADVVQDPARALEEFVIDHSLRAWCTAFERDHNIQLTFTDEATADLRRMGVEAGRLPGDLCPELFSDYGHGLKLLEKTAYEVTREILANPQDSLNTMIRQLYGGTT